MRALTLLEVLVSLSLAAILFTTLFGAYKNEVKASRYLEQIKPQIFARAHTHQRLLQICNGLEDEKRAALWTEELEDNRLALVVEYNNGLQKNPSFSHLIKSSAYLTEKGEMLLKTEGAHDAVKQEVLLTGLKKLSWKFFDPAIGHWQNDWPQAKKKLPLMIKLTCECKTPDHRQFEYAFFLAATEEVINLTP